MLPVTVLTSLLAACLLAGWIFDRVTRARRTKTVRAIGFPLTWLPLVERSLAGYAHLPMDLRESLQEKAFAKLTDLSFCGVNETGEVTDAMRVSLCAHLGLLHARLRIPPIPVIRHLIVGPEADVTAGLDAPGCPWGASTLVTIWEPALHAARCAREERDPELVNHWRRFRPAGEHGPGADHLYFAGWARSLWHDAADRLPALVEKSSELAESAVLFAAASEAFIRHPHALLERHPALFNGLKHFYQFDPTRWTPAPPQAAGMAR